MRMQVKWNHIIAEINQAAGSYLLAVSGGVDSVFMLHFIRQHFGGRLKVAHFNHHLRPEADDEELFVKRLCDELSVECVVGHGDPSTMRAARSLEAEARNQRYHFLRDVLPDSALIVLGHHANDQLETIILRAMRGYPHDNLRMRKRDGDRYRPLLDVPKEVIVRQATTRGYQWREDASNQDLDHERNWVRHELIPQMNARRNVLKSMVYTARESEADPLGQGDERRDDMTPGL